MYIQSLNLLVIVLVNYSLFYIYKKNVKVITFKILK